MSLSHTYTCTRHTRRYTCTLYIHINHPACIHVCVCVVLSRTRTHAHTNTLACQTASLYVCTGAFMHIHTFTHKHIDYTSDGWPLSAYIIYGVQCIIQVQCTNILHAYIHVQWASYQVYAFLTRPAQLCMRMSINDIPDRDGHVHTYIHTYAHTSRE